MIEERQPVWQIAGPMTLLAAYALAGTLPLSTLPYDLFLTGGIGYYLCSRWHVKGCSYAFMLLVFAGICGHLFLESHHFLRLGIEASFICSFIVMSLSFEAETEEVSGLQSQLASRASAIQNFEEEIEKSRQSQIEMQISSAQKIEDLQKNFDEISAEKSSLEILNDVLRKTNAAHYGEKTALENQAAEDKKNLAAAQYALEQLQHELNGLKKIDLALENKSLLHELNAARFDKEQMRQINEALVRLHADESIRAKEAEDLLRKISEEKQRIEEQSQTLQQEILQFTEERHHLESRLRELQTVSYVEQTGRKEIEILKEDRAEIQRRLSAAEQTIHDLAKVDALYKQLKMQFEEKSRVLHETRSLLFKAETDLQTMAIEKEEESSLLPETLKRELDRLDQEISQLQEENVQLQDLATHLIQTFSHSAPFAVHRTPLPAGQPSLEETLREALIPKRKKKAKKPVQQDLLF